MTNVGRFEIEIDANVASASEAIQQFANLTRRATKQIRDDLQGSLGRGVPISEGLSEAEKELVLVTKASKDLSKVLSDIEKQFQGRQLIPEQQETVAQLKQLQKELQDVVSTEKELPKTPFAGFQELSKSQLQVQQFGKVQSAAIKENEAFDAALAKTNSTGGAISGVFAKAEETLNKFGLSVRSVSVLLGVGLASGIAGVIRILEKGITSVSNFVGAEEELARQTELSFRDGSQQVDEFATHVAGQLGASRDEALKTADSFAELRRELQFPEAVDVSFANVLTLISAEAAHTQQGFKNTEDAAKTLASAIQGDEKAFAKLGITLNDVASISLELFGKLPGQLTSAETAIVGVEAASRKAVQEVIEFGVQGKSALQTVKDAFKDTAGNIDTSSKEFVDALHRVRNNLAQTKEDIQGAALASGTNPFTPLILNTQNLGLQLGQLKKDFDKLSEAQLLYLRGRAENKGEKEVVDLIDKELKKRQEIIDLIQKERGEVEKQIDTEKQNREEFQRSASEQESAITTVIALRRAQEDGARRVVEAEKRQLQVQQDNAIKLSDLLERNKRAVTDADTAQKRAALDLQDAQRRVDDANRKAQERVDDENLQHTRRVEDLQHRIAQAHTQAADAILAAELALEGAIIHRNGVEINAAELALGRARNQLGKNSSLYQDEVELRREREDHITKLQRLETERTETAKNGIEEIRHATQTLDDAQLHYNRAVADAIQSVIELKRQNAIALEDAIKNVKAAERERDRAIFDATEAEITLAKTLGFSVDELTKLVDQLLLAKGLSAGAPFGPFGFIGLQAGGPFAAGHPFIAGERGPELVVPERSGGNVVNNDDLRQLLGENKGSTTINIHEVAADPDATAFAVSRILADRVLS